VGIGGKGALLVTPTLLLLSFTRFSSRQTGLLRGQDRNRNGGLARPWKVLSEQQAHAVLEGVCRLVLFQTHPTIHRSGLSTM
jgi:hypothetical protein